MTITDEKALQLVERAKTRLVLSHAFIASLVLQLKTRVNRQIETASTDGVVMEVNPEFFGALNTREQVFIVAHEAFHCAMLHLWRAGSRDPDIWQEAIDYEVNLVLTDAGLEMPKGGLLDKRFQNMACEKIYQILEQEVKSGQRPKPSAGDPGGCGMAVEPGSLSGQPGKEPGAAPGQGQKPGAGGAGGGESTDSQDLREKWQVVMEQAAQAARNAGQGTADIERLAAANKAVKIDWRSLLCDFFTSRAPTDYSWSRPNRRFLHQGMYLPSLGVDSIGPVVVGIDESGSVGPEERGAFGECLNGILEQVRPPLTTVMHWDTVIKKVDEYGPDDFPVDLRARGGGGTDVRCLFAEIDRRGLQPACVVVLTDLCIGGFPAAPDYPVLWIATARGKAPFGQVVLMEL
jgi:predicted metal-dependent peptidase